MKTKILVGLILGISGVGVSIGAQKTGPLTPEAIPATVNDTNNPFAAAFGAVKQFRADVGQIKRSGAPAADGQVAFERMVGQMGVPTQLSHLTFPEEDSDREWTIDAKRVAKGIKPRINYQVVNGESAIYFQGTPAIQQNLQDNVRIIAWYRDQMEKVCPAEKTAVGTYALGRLIDAFLDKFAQSVPRVTVKMNGTINEPRDQKIEYSHREVWEMLSTVNRYFFYKVQIHNDQVKEYYPADVLLMGSMVRTAAIYGADPPPGGLAKIETRLAPDLPDWRGDAYEALQSWVDDEQSVQSEPQQLCTIKIPEPQKPAAPAADPNAFPSDVEDVKEIGGKIFVKRKGYWSLWQK